MKVKITGYTPDLVGKCLINNKTYKEINEVTKYNYVVVNDKLDDAVNKVDASKIDGVVSEASKVTNGISIGSKTFDGSAAVEITADDIPIPEDVVRTSDIATGDAVGVVKSSSDAEALTINVAFTVTVVTSLSCPSYVPAGITNSV